MGKRILTVDDDIDILEVYSLILVAEGYEVKTLLSPSRLAETIVEFVPDLIILDIQLDHCNNGLELCLQLKMSELTRHIPIFIVSSHESIHTAKYQFLANDIVMKPFDLAVLTNKINDCLLAGAIPFRKASA